jgi:hypothetical protein
MLSGHRPINSTRTRSVGPQGVTSDRRNRRHLRELCDEVLASYRVAAGQDLFSDSDRADTRSIMARIAPLGVSKTA